MRLRQIPPSTPPVTRPFTTDHSYLPVHTFPFTGGWYPPLHPNGHDTFNWNCGRGWGFDPDADDCTRAAQYVLAHMPPTVQMIFSDIGDAVWRCGEDLPAVLLVESLPLHNARVRPAAGDHRLQIRLKQRNRRHRRAPVLLDCILRHKYAERVRT